MRINQARLAGHAPFAALIASCVILALGPWMVRLAEVGPVAAGFWRLALALPVLMAAVLMLRPSGGRSVAGSGLWTTLVLGGLFFAADLAAWHAGILHTRLANATLFGNATAFLFPLYGYLVARAWPGRRQAIALALAAAGAALLLGRSFELSPRYLRGDLLCLAAGLFYTAYLVAVDRARAVSPLPALTVVTAAGVLPLFGLALLLGERIVPSDWSAVVALALGSQVIGQGLLVYAVGKLPPLVVGLGLLTQPVVAATVGWFAYDERLGAVDFLGAAAIAVALVLVRLR